MMRELRIGCILFATTFCACIATASVEPVLGSIAALACGLSWLGIERYYGTEAEE